MIKKTIKIVSIILLTAFFAQDLLWAYPDNNKLSVLGMENKDTVSNLKSACLNRLENKEFDPNGKGEFFIGFTAPISLKSEDHYIKIPARLSRYPSSSKISKSAMANRTFYLRMVTRDGNDKLVIYPQKIEGAKTIKTDSSGGFTLPQEFHQYFGGENVVLGGANKYLTLQKYSDWKSDWGKLLELRRKHVFVRPAGDDKKLVAPNVASVGYGTVNDTRLIGDFANPLIEAHIDNFSVVKAVELDENNGVVKIIKRDSSNPRAPPLEKHFSSNGTFEKIKAAKDKALLMRILQKSNFRNLTKRERENILEEVDRVNISLILGEVLVGKYNKISIFVHVRTGYSEKIHHLGLEPTIWMGEIFFNRLNVEQLAQVLLEEAQHIVKPPRQLADGRWIDHGRIAEAIDPLEVIEHDEEFFQSLNESPATLAELSEIAATITKDKAQKADDIGKFYDKAEADGRLPMIQQTSVGSIYGASDTNDVRGIAQHFLSGRDKARVLDLGSGAGKAVAIFSLYAKVKGAEIDKELNRKGIDTINQLAQKGLVDKKNIDLPEEGADFWKEEFSNYDLIYIYWPFFFYQDKVMAQRLEQKLVNGLNPGAVFVLNTPGPLADVIDVFNNSALLEKVELSRFSKCINAYRVRTSQRPGVVTKKPVSPNMAGTAENATLIEKEFTINFPGELNFSGVTIEQKQYQLGGKDGGINPVVEILLNGTVYRVGAGHYVVITLANGKKVYWGGQHNLSYSFFFEHFGARAKEIIEAGGLPWLHLDAHSDLGSYYNTPKSLKNDLEWQDEVDYGASKLLCSNYQGYILTTGAVSRFLWANSLNSTANIVTDKLCVPAEKSGLTSLSKLGVKSGVADLDIDIVVGLNAEMDSSQACKNFTEMLPHFISIADDSEVILMTNSSELDASSHSPLHIDPVLATYFNAKIIEELALKAVSQARVEKPVSPNMAHTELESGQPSGLIRSISQLEPSSGARHIYSVASQAEVDSMLQEIKDGFTKNLIEYGDRFAKGAEGAFVDIGFLPARDSKIRKEISGYGSDRIFHKGLIKDEDGTYWIVKRFDWNREMPKNYPKHEMLAYLLAKERANLTEIRFITEKEAKTIPFIIGNERDFYLSRVVSTSNIDISSLPHKTTHEAFSGIFVANILMRKYDQHPSNVGYTKDIPVSLDHDEAFHYDVLSSDAKFALEYFIWYFLNHQLLKMACTIVSDDPNSQFWKDIDYIRSCLKQPGKGKYAEVLTILGNMCTDLGLGTGLISAEGLNANDIRNSIIAFKSVKNIRELAMAAGYEGFDLKEVVDYIQANQKSLGKDVDRVWEVLTGKPAGFADLDLDSNVDKQDKSGQVNESDDVILKMGNAMPDAIISDKAMSVRQELVGKALILYADDVLERGAAADLVATIRNTNVLDNSTIAIYGRAPGKAQLLEKLVKNAAPEKNIDIVKIENEALSRYSDYQNGKAQIDEAVELGLVLTELKVSHNIKAGDVFGVIKGSTNNIESVSGFAREKRLPIVLFKDTEGVYSFKAALSALVQIVADNRNSGTSNVWYTILAPIKREDIEKMYLEYKIAVNA